MKSLSTSCRLWALVVLCFFLSAASRVQAASGLSLRLYTPPSWVSTYQLSSDRRSVSLSNPVYPRLAFDLERKPELKESFYEENSFRFQQRYYRRGATEQALVPVAVDANSYNEFRRRVLVQEKWDNIAATHLDQAQQNRQRGGLGVNINLPKRLDRIFGEGGAGLRVSGYRRITFSGRSQWTDAKGVAVNQSKFPSLNMEQMYQFDITGTIGSKITVKVSQDSHTDMPLSNNIMIRYKGDEDDILKTIEAGNTNLSLPNTQFVGYSSHIRGLFGVKAEAQLGRLYLTGIASQEKGSSERTTVTPTGEESAQIIRDHMYAERRIFDLGRPGEFQPGDEITRVLVYRELESWQKERPGNAAYAKLHVDPAHPDRFGTERVDLSQDLTSGVVPVEDGEFQWFSKPDSNRHYIVFLSQPRDLSMGVYLEVRRAGSTAIETIGNNTDGAFEDPKELKLIYNDLSVPSFQTWQLMWRNVYPVPTGTQIGDIEVKVYKGLAETENSTTPKDYQETEAGTQTYIEILGLDQYSGANQQNAPDGKIDDRLEIFRSDWGLLIFPNREPFNTDAVFTNDRGQTQPLALKVPGIYNYEDELEKAKVSQYFLKLFTKSRNSEIRLGRPNIIEGSERVTANGVQLVRGEDYRVDYDFGRITLMSEQARDPNADIGIDFEYAPFLSVQKKTLFGFRAEYEVTRDLKIGSTILYKSDKARDRKPRVGEETAKSYVFDADAEWTLRPNFLTRLADALPIIQTESPSNLRLQVEVAQSRPNPNVEGEAYVDDFEASAEQLTLGTARTQWTKSSEPIHEFSNGMGERGKLLWHNPLTPLRVDEVYNKESAAGQSTFLSLRLIFRPNILDTAWTQEPDAPVEEWQPPAISQDVDDDSWAGMQRFFGNRIDKERVQVFEIRARGRTGRMHIDFGRISEDLDGKASAFSEDGVPTGEFLPEEDVGLDGLKDADEPYYHPEFNPDPNNDNWYFRGAGTCPFGPNQCGGIDWDADSLLYEYLNGTEGNAVELENFNRPDKEILGDVGKGLEEENGYFSYVIDFSAPTDPNLDTTMTKMFRDTTSRKTGDAGEPDWYTYRIPIRDPAFLDKIVVDGDDSLSLHPEWTGERVTHVRVWFEQVPGQDWSDTVEIADWYFVQSYWRDTVIFGAGETGTKLVAATISEEDTRFTPPPGVEPYVDPTTNVTEAQRGMMLEFSNLDSRDTAEVRKSVLSVDKYAGYRRLKMYVYGGLEDDLDYGNVMFYFRIGRDSANFYEQRRVLRPGWDESNHVDIDFNEITAIKDAAQRSRERQEWPKIDTVTPDGRQRIKGDPSLNEIKYFVAGIVNSNPARLPSGEIWLDELRVGDVRKDVGTAARFSANGNIADLGTYSFNYQTQDPYFRGLSSSTRGGSDQNLGSGSSDTRISYSMALNADKFLPRSWNARLPVNFSYSKNTRLPLLRTGSDIVLPDDIRQAEQEVSESRMISVSAQFNKPGRNPLFSLLLNRLQNTSFSYRRSLQQSPRVPYGLTEGYNLRSGFDFGLKKNPTLSILGWAKSIPILRRLAGTELGLYPSRFTTSWGYDRSLTVTDDIEGKRRSSFQRTGDAKLDLAYSLFQNLSLSFRADTRRDLSDPKDVSFSLSDLRLGLETHFAQQFSAKYTPGVFSWLSTDLGFNGSYSDDLERSTSSRRSTMSSSWSVSGRFDHIGFLGGDGGGTEDRRFRGRGGVSGGRGDRGSKTEGEEKEESRPIWDYPLAGLRFLTGWIDAPSYNYSESFRSSLPGSLERPSLKYRLGLTREPGVIATSGSTNPSASEGVSYDFGSGFTFLGGFQTTVKFRQSITRDLIKRGDLFEDISTSWPDLTIQIRQFTTLPLIKGPVNKFIDIFSPRTAYSRSTRERKDLGGDFLISRSTNTAQNPLLSLNFKLFRALSLTSSYGLSKERSEQFNQTSGSYTGGSENVRKSIGGSVQYSFAAPSGISLPIFGKLKFRSTVNMALDVKFNKSTNKTFDAKGQVNNVTNNDEMEVRPDISYTFSQQIKGGLSMRWRDSNVSNQKTHLREVQIWMEIRF